ncbi:MAG TPA: hypothetical protein VGW14_05670 [Thermoleophilaceae bacterium]|nr:hypothetical protein [Thermoleophilaceae bacterium]
MNEAERRALIERYWEWRNQYPASVTLELGELRGAGDLWVAEGAIRYDDGPGQPALNVLEFRGNKVARESVYVMESWEAPEWRARWRAAPEG